MSTGAPGTPDLPYLRQIAEAGFRSDPRQLRLQMDVEPSPIEDMLGSSALLDYVRQRLPYQLSDTAPGRWLQRKSEQVPDGTLRADLVNQIQDLKLGGFEPENAALRQQLRQEDPLVRRNTVQVGLVPTPDGLGEIPIGDSARAAAAQAGGVALGDLASDGLRNIWWFLNAPQAIASLAVLQAVHGPAKEQSERLLSKLDYGENEKPVTPYGSRRVRMAAAAPAVIGMSLAIGNALRQPGYKAALPSEADPTQTSDPLAEFGARYFLGRSGELMAYEDFVKERPDVSKAEFDAYKAYLFGSASPIKASLDGINGPEVNFIGKSVPILTGVIPTIAAAVGARRGMRKAMERLQANEDQLAQAEQARLDYRRAERDLRNPNSGATQADVDKLKEVFAKIQEKNDLEILKQSLLGSAKYMVPSAIIGQTLESIRRSLPREQPPEPEPVPAAKKKQAAPELAAAPVPIA